MSDSSISKTISKIAGYTNDAQQGLHKRSKDWAKRTNLLGKLDAVSDDKDARPKLNLKNLVTASLHAPYAGGVQGLAAGNDYRSAAKWLVGGGRRYTTQTEREPAAPVNSLRALGNTQALAQNGLVGVAIKRVAGSLAAGVASLVVGADKAEAADQGAQKVVGKVNDLLRFPILHVPAGVSALGGVAVGTGLGAAGLLAAATIVGARAAITTGLFVFHLGSTVVANAAAATDDHVGGWWGTKKSKQKESDKKALSRANSGASSNTAAPVEAAQAPASPAAAEPASAGPAAAEPAPASPAAAEPARANPAPAEPAPAHAAPIENYDANPQSGVR